MTQWNSEEQARNEQPVRPDDESGKTTPSGGRDRGQTSSQQTTTPPKQDSESIHEQLTRDLQRLAETFNDVRDKRQAMNIVDVNETIADPSQNEISRIMEPKAKLAQPIPRNAGATNGASHRCHARRPSVLDCRPIILAQTISKENNPQNNRDAGRAQSGNHRNAAAPPDRPAAYFIPPDRMKSPFK